MCHKPRPKCSSRKTSVPPVAREGHLHPWLCLSPFHSRCWDPCATSCQPFPLTAPSHTQSTVIRHSVSVPCTTPRGISYNQNHIPNVTVLYFPSLTVPHCFTKKVLKIFCNSILERQTNVKWEQNTWLISREMKSLWDEKRVKHPYHRSHPLSSWPPCPLSEALIPDI